MRVITADYHSSTADQQKHNQQPVQSAFTSILEEIQDGIDMLALRAQHVGLIYSALAPQQKPKRSAETVGDVLAFLVITWDVSHDACMHIVRSDVHLSCLTAAHVNDCLYALYPCS